MSKELKRCASCHIKKPFNAFSVHPEMQGALNASCDDCIASRAESGQHRGTPKVRGKILRYPNYVLTLPATDVLPGPLAEKVIKKLLYASSMVKWGRVAGLAAPQIGYSVRLFIIGPEAFLNPEIIQQDGFYETEEGCYSLEPMKYDYKVTRPAFLTLRWQDVGGTLHTEKFESKKAQIIAHEVDHLNGVLCATQPKMALT